MLGARLLEQLGLPAFGVTGPALRDAGCEPVGEVDELSLVGFTGVVAHLPRLARRLAALEQEILRRNPSVVVTVDSPSFNLRLARRLRGKVPIVHWVAPQVWAWRRGRAARVHDSVDGLACLFPFEPQLFGPRAEFTGHPAAAIPRSSRPPALGVAAGSRPEERRRLGPVFAATAERLGIQVVEAVPPGQEPVVPGARRVADAAQMAALVSVALVASGTATLELGCAGVPMVVAYATSPLNFWIGKRLVRVPHLALPNLLLGQPVVSEALQDLRPAALARSIDGLLGPAGDRVAERLTELPDLVRGGGVQAVADLVSRAASQRTSSHFAASTKSL